MKLLFIEDEKKRNTYFVSDLIESFNIDVDWILDFKSILEVLRISENLKKYDAIILDFMLPLDDSLSKEELKKASNGLSMGLIIIDYIRAVNDKIPILIYSARGDINKYISQYKNITYLQKPKRPEIIIEELNHLIKKVK